MSKLKDLLDKIGSETIKLIKDEIVSQGLIKTGDLRDSIEYEVIQNGSGYELDFSMIYYGEYLDKGTKYIQPPREFYEKIIQEQLSKYEEKILEATIDDIMDI